MDRTLALCGAAFERWRGGAVEFVALRQSVRTAFFEITAGNRKHLLQLADPIRIESPIRWSNCDLKIDHHGSDALGPLYQIVDQTAGFKVICGGAGVGEMPSKLGGI